MILDPVRSLVDFPFYREVPKKSIAETVGYLAYIGLVFALLSLIALYARVGPRIDEGAEWAAVNIPTMTLEKGKLSSALPGPVRIQHPASERLAFVIDTTRTTPVAPAELAASTASAFVTQNTVYVLNNDKMEAYDLGRAQNAEPVKLDAAFYRNAAAVLKKVLYPIAFFTTWLVFFVWKHLSALVYSLLGLLISAGLKAELEHGPLYRAAVYAQTPVIVLQAVMLFLPRPIPYFGLLSLILVGVYLWQAIRQMRPAPAAPPAEA
ncbi:MAG: DUF1189 family protein [Elusimicrobiota bacterium]|jgi:hypothetical protein